MYCSYCHTDGITLSKETHARQCIFQKHDLKASEDELARRQAVYESYRPNIYREEYHKSDGTVVSKWRKQ